MMAIVLESAAAPFTEWLAEISAVTEKRLDEILARYQPSSTLTAAMRHAALGGGKRLRPAMLLAVAEEDGQIGEAALNAACAVELIHCYSLVHDDLPAMDNDDERRGRPACHVVYGEGMALLAGDCLQSLAFEVLGDEELSPAAVRHLARAGGAGGMGGGQALDILDSCRSTEEFAAMYRLKTGALFACTLQLGYLCRRRQPPQWQEMLAIFADEFGLLFQLSNDQNDREQDRQAGKITYATAHGDDIAAHAARARQKAVAAVPKALPRLLDITEAVA